MYTWTHITWLLGPFWLATTTNLLLCLWYHHERGHITIPSITVHSLQLAVIRPQMPDVSTIAIVFGDI